MIQITIPSSTITITSLVNRLKVNVNIPSAALNRVFKEPGEGVNRILDLSAERLEELDAGPLKIPHLKLVITHNVSYHIRSRFEFIPRAGNYLLLYVSLHLCISGLDLSELLLCGGVLIACCHFTNKTFLHRFKIYHLVLLKHLRDGESTDNLLPIFVQLKG